jgi:hypothetical protein
MLADEAKQQSAIWAELACALERRAQETARKR